MAMEQRPYPLRPMGCKSGRLANAYSTFLPKTAKTNTSCSTATLRCRAHSAGRDRNRRATETKASGRSRWRIDRQNPYGLPRCTWSVRCASFSTGGQVARTSSPPRRCLRASYVRSPVRSLTNAYRRTHLRRSSRECAACSPSICHIDPAVSPGAPIAARRQPSDERRLSCDRIERHASGASFNHFSALRDTLRPHDHASCS